MVRGAYAHAAEISSLTKLFMLYLCTDVILAIETEHPKLQRLDELRGYHSKLKDILTKLEDEISTVATEVSTIEHTTRVKTNPPSSSPHRHRTSPVYSESTTAPPTSGESTPDRTVKSTATTAIFAENQDAATHLSINESEPVEVLPVSFHKPYLILLNASTEKSLLTSNATTATTAATSVIPSSYSTTNQTVTLTYSNSIPTFPSTTLSSNNLNGHPSHSSGFRFRERRPLTNRFILNTTGCLQWSTEQLVKMLKEKGTYNPYFMAWDVMGVRRFLSKAAIDSYDKEPEDSENKKTMTLEQNLDAIEKMISELDLKNCEIGAPEMKSKLYNITSGLRSYYKKRFKQQGTDDSMGESIPQSRKQRDIRREQGDPSEPSEDPSLLEDHSLSPKQLLRQIFKTLENYGYKADSFRQNDYQAHDSLPKHGRRVHDSTEHRFSGAERDDGHVGTVHLFECEERGSTTDGYLRMCGTCRAIRVMPRRFFPPFINEIVCDEDKACLYFYDYPHGKCKQKFLSFVVLENIGTKDCQIWRKFNLNVRVCCECFVDQLSFFAKYV